MIFIIILVELAFLIHHDHWHANWVVVWWQFMSTLEFFFHWGL